jgi:hypothetical protein
MNARIASLLAALGLSLTSVGVVNGQFPEDLKAALTVALVGAAGWIAPSIIRLPDAYMAQLLSVVATLVAAGLDWLVVQSDAGSSVSTLLVAVLVALAGLFVPGVHLHNAPPDGA